MPVIPKIRIAGNLHERAQDTAVFIHFVSEHAIKSHGRFIIALSGGSTPKKIYRVLATAEWKARIDWSRIFFCSVTNAASRRTIRIAISTWRLPRCFNRSTSGRIIFAE